MFSLTSIVCILFSSSLWIAEGTSLGCILCEASGVQAFRALPGSILSAPSPMSTRLGSTSGRRPWMAKGHSLSMQYVATPGTLRKSNSEIPDPALQTSFVCMPGVLVAPETVAGRVTTKEIWIWLLDLNEPGVERQADQTHLAKSRRCLRTGQPEEPDAYTSRRVMRRGRRRENAGRLST